MFEDWQNEESFALTNLRMLEDGHLCDVTLLAGEEREEVRCHRFILASRSPVFHAMFCGSLPEKDVVEIPDIEADVLKQVVRFLYTSSVELNAESVLFVAYAAKKYAIKGLENKCKVFLENNMSADNVCTILEHAAKFDCKELMDKCMKLVEERAKEVFASDSFLTVSKIALGTIVEGVKYTDPLTIYEACKTWANYQIVQQEKDASPQEIRVILGDILRKIRFIKMPLEVFVDSVVVDNILEDSEMKIILLEIREEQRKTLQEQEICIQRSGRIPLNCKTLADMWKHTGKQDGISFTVSCSVWLAEVFLFLPVQVGGMLRGVLEVFEGESLMLAAEVNLIGQDQKQFERVKLPRRIWLHEKKVYSIRQRLKGDPSYNGKDCATDIHVENINVIISDLKVGTSDNYTSRGCGQIHGMTLIKI